MNLDKNNIILYLKKPKTWFIIFGLISVIILCFIIYKLLKTTPPPPLITCNPPQVVHQCSDNTSQCADVCENGQSWDCTTQKCSCSNGTTLCEKNTKCCSTCDQSDLCCTQKIKKDDKYTCCDPGTIPNTGQTECVAACGTGLCDTDQECIVIKNVTQAQADAMQKESDSNWRGAVCSVDNCTVSICTNPTCVWEATATSVPKPIGDFHPYYNIDFYGDDNLSLCFPSSTAYDNDTKCLENTTQSACTTNGCTWSNVLEYFNTYPSFTQALLNNWQTAEGSSPNGYYCGDGTDGSFMRLEQVVSSKTQDDCLWSDCVSRISNPGVTQVLWDNTTRLCSALIGGSDGGIGSSVTCTDENQPCSLCKKKGDQVDCVKCNGTSYIPSSDCKSTNWEFKKCVDIITKDDNGSTIYPEVLNYSCNDCNGTSCTTTSSPYCGNCPWGGNTTTQDDYTQIDNTHVYGNKTSSPDSSLVCYNDGQIKPKPGETKWYPNGFNDALQVDCNPSATGTGTGFDTRLACIQSLCGTENVTCCDTGWTYINGKCIPKITPSCTTLEDALAPKGDYYMICDFTASKSLAGNAYTAGCSTCKYANDSGTVSSQPSVTPSNPNNLPIPYCVCDGKQYVNINSKPTFVTKNTLAPEGVIGCYDAFAESNYGCVDGSIDSTVNLGCNDVQDFSSCTL